MTRVAEKQEPGETAAGALSCPPQPSPPADSLPLLPGGSFSSTQDSLLGGPGLFCGPDPREEE